MIEAVGPWCSTKTAEAAPAQRLDPERAAAGEKIENPRPGHEIAERRENSRTDPVHRGAGSFSGGFEGQPPRLAGNHAHGGRGCLIRGARKNLAIVCTRTR